MALRYHGLGRAGYSRLTDAIDLAEMFPSIGFRVPIETERLGALDPLLLGYWPFAKTNQFQSLLYRQSWQHGVGCLPFLDEAELAAMPWAGAMACHFHWLASINDEDAVARFEALLRRLKMQSRKIIWTVHNVLPHDNPDTEQAVRVRKLIVDMCDVVHILNERTAELVEPYFSIANKPIFYSPHPSYIGEFPNSVSREEARFQLGIRADLMVFLAFGAIQPYKGIENLIDAAERLVHDRPDRDLRLVVAGEAKDEQLIRRIRASQILDDCLIVHGHKISPDDVQYFFKAADFAVCPYRQSLNSGAAMLSASFGVPLIAPRTAAFDEILAYGAGMGYEPDDEGALSAALAAAFTVDPREMRRNALAIAEERRAEKASALFFEGLKVRLGY